MRKEQVILQWVKIMMVCSNCCQRPDMARASGLSNISKISDLHLNIRPLSRGMCYIVC